MCGAKDRSKTIKDVHDWFFECIDGSWNIAVCADCATLFLDPRPVEKDLPLAYTSYYTHAALEKEPIGESLGVRSSRQWITNSILNARFGTRLEPCFPLSLPEIVARPFMNDRIESRFRNFPKLFLGAKILDVGCGSGKFLKRIRRAGWRGFGVDFDKKAVNEAQIAGLNVIVGDISCSEVFSEKFDAISFNHVIEHVPDIPQTLKTAYRLLKSDAFLHLEYPNPQADGLARYGRFWRGLEAPRHLCIPSRNAITTMLKEIGFHRVIFSTGNLDAANVDAASKDAAKRNLASYIEPEATKLVEPAFLKLIAWR
tara:strand:+ start:92198 stop:93136 length:939 start_codon:yes stop_codon:yes gene_type:complete